MSARTFVDPFDPRGQVLTAWDHDPNSTPRVVEDEDSLRRQHLSGLSKSGRREQRRPVAIKVDEYGIDRKGRYWAGWDGAR